MNPLKDYYSFLNDFKKNNKSKNFKKSLVKCPYCNSEIKGNSLKYHMTTTDQNIKNKYQRLGKNSKIDIKKNYNDVEANDITKSNDNLNQIKNITSNNDNDISNNNITKNNNFINNSLNDMIKKRKRSINSQRNSYIDSLEKKSNSSNSMESKKSDYNKDKGVYNCKENNDIESSLNFNEKNADDDKKKICDFHPESFTFKQEYPLDNGKILEEFKIKGNKIISNLNKEETQKRIFQEMCKLYDYFINYNKFIFIHKKIRKKSKIITNNNSFNSKKRHRVEESDNYEGLRNILLNLKNKGYFNYN